MSSVLAHNCVQISSITCGTELTFCRFASGEYYEEDVSRCKIFLAAELNFKRLDSLQNRIDYGY